MSDGLSEIAVQSCAHTDYECDCDCDCPRFDGESSRPEDYCDWPDCDCGCSKPDCKGCELVANG